MMQLDTLHIQTLLLVDGGVLSDTRFIGAVQQNLTHCHRQHRQPETGVIVLLVKCAMPLDEALFAE